MRKEASHAIGKCDHAAPYFGIQTKINSIKEDNHTVDQLFQKVTEIFEKTAIPQQKPWFDIKTYKNLESTKIAYHLALNNACLENTTAIHWWKMKFRRN